MVKVSTLKAIKREIDKCDSLKVAYDLKSKALDELVTSNTKLFEEFFETRKEKEVLQDQLQEEQNKLHKLLQKPNTGWLIPAAVALTVGVIIGSN